MARGLPGHGRPRPTRPRLLCPASVQPARSPSGRPPLATGQGRGPPRWFLHELDPELAVASRGLRRLCILDHLAQALIQHHGTLAAIAAELVADCRRLSERINVLEGQIRRLVAARAPHLLAIPGCGVLGAAVIIGEAADATRFTSKAAFARFNGTAPIPVWSGNKVRVRLNRGGNRTVSHALHMIAVTQVRGDGEGATYFARQLTGVKETVFVLDGPGDGDLAARPRPTFGPARRVDPSLGPGSQYTSFRLAEHLDAAGIAASIGSVGDAYDNALMESTIGLFKTELIKPRRPWKTLSDVELAPPSTSTGTTTDDSTVR